MSKTTLTSMEKAQVLLRKALEDRDLQGWSRINIQNSLDFLDVAIQRERENLLNKDD